MMEGNRPVTKGVLNTAVTQTEANWVAGLKWRVKDMVFKTGSSQEETRLLKLRRMRVAPSSGKAREDEEANTSLFYND